MGESSWSHASWVSPMGKWAWVVLVINCIIGIIVSIILLAIGALWWFLLGGLVWNIIACIIGLVIGFFIIRPKFSKPCGEQDWDALYDWGLKLGSVKIPWMLIWGILLLIFSWYAWGSVLVIIPALVLLFLGPKKYDWKA